jgi:hypothetical protein
VICLAIHGSFSIFTGKYEY